MKLSNKNVGIVGQGFVGTAIREKFKSKYNVFTYDKHKAGDSKVYHLSETSDYECSNTDIVENCDITFVCVPTPMFQNGKCDISIVEEVLDNLEEKCKDLDTTIIAIIKSTVPPGTTSSLHKKYNRVSVIFSPEFLTEANAISDFNNQTRIVLGIDWIEHVEPAMALFTSVFPKADIIVINSIEAEMSKYFTNLFLATKVSFFNDMYKICNRLNRSGNNIQDINYDNVIEATLHDDRIGNSHYMVPGPDGDFGYGGHCFPKDMAAILHIADVEGISIPTILGAHTTNQMVRNNKDWEKMKGRAVVDQDEIINVEEEDKSVFQTSNGTI